MKSTLFGRKWKITVIKANGEEAWKVADSTDSKTALKCTFYIEQNGFQTPWYSEVSIYNLGAKTMNDMIMACNEEGASVNIEAGYKNGKYGTIFSGKIFQPLFDRQNVVDYVLTLSCIDGLGLLTGNLCSASLKAGYDYALQIATMAKNSMTPISIAENGITPSLDSKKAPRGKTFFDVPHDILRDITKDNNASFWIGDNQLNVSKLDDKYEGEAQVYSATTGLIGTPQQTTNGVSFRVLLNPELKVKRPLMVVKLDTKLIQQQKLKQGSVVSPLDKDGYYKIIKVTHIGDTRGNEWYTNLLGVNMIGNVPLLLGQVQS